ncbi:MAG: ComEA family DNA-binding protein [Acidimicrobiia bacterium]
MAPDSDPIDAWTDAPASPRPRWRAPLDAAADATGSTPARVAGGLALLVVLAVGAWWTLRPPAAPVELGLPYAPTTVPAPGPGAPAAPGATAGPEGVGAPGVGGPATTVAPDVVVHVAGAVASPGIVRLAPGARVVDAVAAAGGATEVADPDRVNLAAPLVDGERVYLPAVGEDAVPPVVAGSNGVPGGGAAAPGGRSAGAGGEPVDLNAADEATLDGLPGVGPSTATAIVAHRSAIGGFTSVDQLLDVRGIGEAKLEQLRPLVRV